MVTADEIRLMNAHTVAEVLNTVTGVQVFLTGGPGSSAAAFIQGSGSRHVAVFINASNPIPLSATITRIRSLRSSMAIDRRG